MFSDLLAWLQLLSRVSRLVYSLLRNKNLSPQAFESTVDPRSERLPISLVIIARLPLPLQEHFVSPYQINI